MIDIKRLMGLLIIGALMVPTVAGAIFISKDLFDYVKASPEWKQLMETGEVVVCDTVASSCVRDTAAQTSSSYLGPSDHVRRVTEHEAPEWSIGELLYELHEVYLLAQSYRSGDTIDTALVGALVTKLNCLVDRDIADRDIADRKIDKGWN